MNDQIHFIQREVLKKLLLSESCTFNSMIPEGVYSDHFNFHLKQLIKHGYVVKNDAKLYELTSIGKEFANRFDIDAGSVKYEKQAKIGVIVKAVRDTPDGREYLIQQRLKQPFYGFHGCPGGKIKYGELVTDAAARELLEEAGLTAQFELVLIEHRKDVTPDGTVLEDKYFYIFRATQVAGELLPEFDSGKNMWMTRDQIVGLEDCFVGLVAGLDIIDNHTGPHPLFLERVNVVEKY